MSPKTHDDDNEPKKKLVLRRASEIEPRELKWFYAPGQDRLLPVGVMSLFTGRGGCGKSSLSVSLSSQLSVGELPGHFYGTPHNSLIMGPEDAWSEVMIPRIMAAEGDLQRIFQIAVETTYDDVTGERELLFPLDVDMVREAVEATEAKLLIIDPVSSALQNDMAKAQDTRRALMPLIKLAEDYQFALVAINHVKKSNEGGFVGNLSSGSHALRDLCRCHLLFAEDPATGQRIFTHEKGNYGGEQKSYAFDLVGVDVPVINADGEQVVVSHPRAVLTGESEMTADDIFNRDDKKDARSDAESFILTYLRDRDGSAPATELMAAGAELGFSERQLQRARKSMSDPRVATKQDGFRGPHVWRLDITPVTGTGARAGVPPVSSVSGVGEAGPSLDRANNRPARPTCDTGGTHDTGAQRPKRTSPVRDRPDRVIEVDFTNVREPKRKAK